MACALAAAQCGHRVTAYDAASPGGQLKLAARIPGKQEFNETLRYYRHALQAHDVEVVPGREVSAEDIRTLDCDHIVIATGVKPRMPAIPGIDHPRVVSYADIISGRVEPGRRVAIIGAGGIGFDVAVYLMHADADWYRAWGIDKRLRGRGGLLADAQMPHAQRQVFLLQRKRTKPGAQLGKTTGWIHRVSLRRQGVEMLSGVDYLGIDDSGLHISVSAGPRLLDVDQIIVCAGQESEQTLARSGNRHGAVTHLIGGAQRAVELDAERAMRQGVELALSF
jgi:2,4-dienoyl-CoA reductase (NADPH2)